MQQRLAADVLDLREISGLVLAGGAGTRMGGADKGLIVVAGEALVSRAVARLAPQVGTVLISANRNQDRYRQEGCAVVEDHYPNRPGPLAGWHAAFAATTSPWLASVPCDAPFFPRDLVSRLAQGIGSAPAALVCTASGRQPVFALLHRRLMPTLAAALDRGEHRVGNWLRTIGAREVMFAAADAFLNLNDAAALRAAETLLQQPVPPGESDAATNL